MKKVVIGLVLFLVLLIGGALVLPSMIDWNNYKDKISAQVMDATGRKLDITGDVTFSLFPQPTLTVGKAALQNAEGATDAHMITMDGLEIRVAPGALLDGQLQMQMVSLVNPSIILEMLPSGEGNWMFPFLKKKEKQQFDDSAIGTRRAVKTVQFESIVLKNGAVVYKDIADGIDEKIHSLTAEIMADSLKGPFLIEGLGSYDNMPVAFKASLGRVEPEKATEITSIVNLVEPEKEGEENARQEAISTLRFSGLISRLSEGLSMNGNLSVDVHHPQDFLAVFTDQFQVPPALRTPFSLTTEIVASKEKATLSECVFKHGKTAAAGSIELLAGKGKEENDPNKLTAKLMFSQFDLEPIVEAFSQGFTAEGKDPAAFELPYFLADLDMGMDVVPFKKNVLRETKVALMLTPDSLEVSEISGLFPGGGGGLLAGRITSKGDAPYFDANVEFAPENLKELLSWLDMLPDGLAPRAFGQTKVTAKVKGNASKITFSDVDGRVDGTKFKGTVGIKRGDKTAYGFLLDLDKLSLDRYIAAEQKGAAAQQQAEKEGEALSALEQVKTSLTSFFETLAPLGDVTANVRVKLGSLKKGRYLLQGVGADLVLSNGAARIKQIRVGDLAGARFSFSGGVSGFGSAPVFKDFSYDFYTAKLGPFLTRTRVDLPFEGGDLSNVSLKGTLGGKLDDLSFKTTSGASGLSLQADGTYREAEGIPSYAMTFSARHNTFRKAISLFDRSYVPYGKALGNFRISGTLDRKDNLLTISKVDMGVGLATLEGNVAVDLAGERPVFDATLKGGIVPILDFWQRTSSPQGGKGQTPFSGGTVNLSFLKKLDGKMALDAEALKIDGISMKDAAMRVKLNAGIVDIESLTGTVGDGAISFGGTLDARKEPRLQGKISASGANIAEPFLSFLPLTPVAGALSFNAEGATEGESPYDWATRLTGKMMFSVQNGALKGVGLKKLKDTLGDMRSPDGLETLFAESFTPENRTVFTELSGRLSFDKGQVNALDIKMLSPSGEMRVVTDMSLADWRMTARHSVLLANPALPGIEVAMEGAPETPKTAFELTELKAYLGGLKEADESEAARLAAEAKAAQQAEENRKKTIQDIKKINLQIEEEKSWAEMALSDVGKWHTSIKEKATGLQKTDIFITEAETIEAEAKADVAAAQEIAQKTDVLYEGSKASKTPEEAKEKYDAILDDLGQVKVKRAALEAALKEIEEVEKRLDALMAERLKSLTDLVEEYRKQIWAQKDEAMSLYKETLEIAEKTKEMAAGVITAGIFVSDADFAAQTAEKKFNEINAMYEGLKRDQEESIKHGTLSYVESVIEPLPSMQEQIAELLINVRKQLSFVKAAEEAARQAVEEAQAIEMGIDPDAEEEGEEDSDSEADSSSEAGETDAAADTSPAGEPTEEGAAAETSQQTEKMPAIKKSKPGIIRRSKGVRRY